MAAELTDKEKTLHSFLEWKKGPHVFELDNRHVEIWEESSGLHLRTRWNLTDEVLTYLKDNFADSDWSWQPFSYRIYIRFENDNDAVAFKMRWL